MLKMIVVSITLVVGSLVSVLSTGQSTPEDIYNWLQVSQERVRYYVSTELGSWIVQQATPMVSAILTLLGCVVYTLLFRKTPEGEVTEPPPKRIVPPQGDSGTAVLESNTVKKAKARALHAQLVTDKMNLQARQNKALQELVTSEHKAAVARTSKEQAKKILDDCEMIHEKMARNFEKIRSETIKNEKELQALNEEINKLNGVC